MLNLCNKSITQQIHNIPECSGLVGFVVDLSICCSASCAEIIEVEFGLHQVHCPFVVYCCNKHCSIRMLMYSFIHILLFTGLFRHLLSESYNNRCRMFLANDSAVTRYYILYYNIYYSLFTHYSKA